VKPRSALVRAIALLCLLLALAACAQPVPVDKADYIGHWRGEGVLLVIRADGHADYEKVQGQRRTSIKGPAHTFSTDGFRIGIGPLSARFSVQSPPRLEDGTWRMTVDGVELTRADLGQVIQQDQPSIST
jgi:hypothetical protein